MNVRCHGFTLIETLIGLTVLGFILVLLGEGVRAGSRATDTYNRLVHAEVEREPVERAVRLMLERMNPGIYPDPPVVRGSANMLAFTTELPAPASGASLAADVRLEISGGDLVLWWSSRTAGVPFDQRPPNRMVLLRHIARGDLSYAARTGPTVWLKAWDKPEMPGAVRLRLALEDEKAPWPALVVSPSREQAEE